MRSISDLRNCRRGVVYVEFLLVLPPLFTLFLVILQWSLLSAASLGVRHAAAWAARSAVVVLPDDPIAYEGTPAYEIDINASCSEGFSGKFAKLARKLGARSAPVPASGRCPGGPRFSAIRFAAVARMVPFAPNLSGLLPASLAAGVPRLGAAGWLAGAAAYSYGATSLNFPIQAGSNEMRTSLSFDKSDKPVTVRVNYLAHCGIPIARFFMCDRSWSLLGGRDVEVWRRDLSSIRTVNKRIERSAPGMEQLAAGVGSAEILSALLVSGEYFSLLHADATLPMNSAPYDYKEKHK